MRRIVAILVVLTLGLVPVAARAGVKQDFQTAVKYYKSGRIAEAVELFKKVEKKTPKNPEVKYYLALCFLKQQNWDGAIHKSNQALKLKPGFIRAYLSKAHAQIGKEAYNAALETVQKGMEQAPEHVELWYTRGVILSHQQDYPGAIEAFTKVLAVQPDRAYAHYYLGLSYYNAGRKAEAIQSFERFLQLAPDAPEAAQVQELLRRLRG